MIRLFLIFFLSLNIYSFAGGCDASAKKDLLKKEIDLLIDCKGEKAQIGIYVISRKTGEVIYEKGASRLFVPGSLAKLVTASAALEMLGPDFVFETKLFYDGTIQNGVLNGNLYLQASGDPTLTTADIEALTLQIKLLGIQTIKGSLIVDLSVFDTIQMGPGWMWDEPATVSHSKLDSLMVNHSCLSVWTAPSSVMGEKPTVLLSPDYGLYAVRDLAITGKERGKFEVTRQYLLPDGVITVQGTVELGTAPELHLIPVDNPHIYASRLFKKLMEKTGLELKGCVRVGSISQKAKEIAKQRSKPLSLIVYEMLKDSDNLYADALFKKIGASVLSGPGSWENGAKAIRKFLENRVNICSGEEIRILDGSGLTRYNLLSPKQVATLLFWIDNDSLFGPEFFAALPVSGGNGTLKNRMLADVGRVRAKTASMTGLSGLAGVIKSSSGEEFIFALLINNFTGPLKTLREQIEDEICKQLLKY